MKRLCTHSLVVAAVLAATCLLLVRADSAFSDKVNLDGQSVTDSSLHTAWWELPPSLKWLPEVVVITFLILYIANIWIGRAKNSEIAMSFVDTFCTEGSLLDRNFSQVGARIDGTLDLILRESMNKFNIYATGRRFCKNLQATLDLKHRQDLFFMGCYVVNPREDLIDIDIAMNSTNMEPLVLLIAAPRLAKEMSKTLPDVQSFAHPIEVDTKRLPGFPVNDLSVWAESRTIFHDLMTDKVTDLLFGRLGFDAASTYFRYLHFSSENPEGFSKHNLKLSFFIPPKEQMQDLTNVLSAALHFIDVSVSFHALQSARRPQTASLPVACLLLSCHCLIIKPFLYCSG